MTADITPEAAMGNGSATLDADGLRKLASKASELVNFLHGSGPLDGLWFGDSGGGAAFWWRSELARVYRLISAVPALAAERGALSARVKELEAERDDAEAWEREHRRRAEALAAENARLVGKVTSLRDAISANIIVKAGPHTVLTQDGEEHSGPLADYIGDILDLILQALDAALKGDKP